MDGVHSSSLKGIVQGESVGARPSERTDIFGALAGLIPVPILTQVILVLTNLLFSTGSIPET